jgi:phospholipid-binding lipoprotein MlaA
MSMQKPIIPKPLLVGGLIFSIMLTGCATTTVANKDDPWAGWNRGTQSFNDSLDKAVLKPMAKGYRWITPDVVDKGISNFFSNINDIGVFLNDFLQLKLTQGSMDAGRFLINTTAGVGGFIDVAKMIDLPKHKEDFGQTLGFWGVPSGSYLVLPFFGPSSPRDTVGLIGDALFNPLTYVSVFGGAAVNAATAGARIVDVTDTRADIMTTEKVIDEAAVDRYDFIKNAYQQNREYVVHDGNPPDDNDPDLLNDDVSEDADGQGKGTDTLNSIPTGGINNSTTSTKLSDMQPDDKKPGHFLELTTPQ